MLILKYNSFYLVYLLSHLCFGFPVRPEYEIEDSGFSGYPVYPFQQYTQVRKSYSVQHLPVYSHPSADDHSGSHSQSSGLSLDPTAASSDHSSSDGKGESYGNYHPRLREAIETWGKQEVYEEKGYTDSDYDHYNTGGSDNYQDHSGGQPTNGVPQYRTLAETDDGSSTDLLRYAATSLYDRDAHQQGIYRARSGHYCPHVIDFDMSSKSMKMGQGDTRPAGKPRLTGLGSKIHCLRRKYFGNNPFPKTIFKQPEDSIKSRISSGCMEQFMADFNRNIHR